MSRGYNNEQNLRNAWRLLLRMRLADELALQARRSAAEAGLSVSEWLVRMPAEERQRAVDYTLDVLMSQGPMNDERPWYNLIHQ